LKGFFLAKGITNFDLLDIYSYSHIKIEGLLPYKVLTKS